MSDFDGLVLCSKFELKLSATVSPVGIIYLVLPYVVALTSALSRCARPQCANREAGARSAIEHALVSASMWHGMR
jgi:hypothetical protein